MNGDNLLGLLLGGGGIITAIVTYVLLERRMRVEAQLKAVAERDAVRLDEERAKLRLREAAEVAEQAAEHKANEILEAQGLKRITDLERQVEYLTKERDRLTSRIAELTKDSDERRVERERLRQRVDKLVQTVEAKESRIRALETSEDKNTETIFQLKDKITAMQERIGYLERANDELTKHRESLTAENERLNGEVKRLNGLLIEREKELNSLKQRQEDLSAEVEAVKNNTNGH